MATVAAQAIAKKGMATGAEAALKVILAPMVMATVPEIRALAPAK